MSVPLDQLGRPLRDLRISVTDRCNFRCVYCMPREIFGPGHAFLPRRMLLDFEEIQRVARASATLGVRKIRLTGGEPLLRRGLPKLIAMLADIDGVEDLALTTNGSLLATHASALKAAGLRRVTVSLDALDADIFRRINDTRDPPQTVLDGIAAAAQAGLGVKVNTVVKHGSNDNQILPLAEYFRNSGHTLRFIEYMDVGNSNAWQLDEVLTASQIRARIEAHWALDAVTPRYPGEVAARYRYRDGAGEIGFITSVSQPFCRGCTRLRLAADGKLYTCLFAHAGHDLRARLRNGITEAELQDVLAGIWGRREDRYSELRASGEDDTQKVEMSYIGG